MYSYDGCNVGFSPAVNQDRILVVHSFFLIVLEGKKGGGKKHKTEQALCNDQPNQSIC